MEKESYSIDDILSEVKKRRKEQERELKKNSPTQESRTQSSEVKKESVPQKPEKRIVSENIDKKPEKVKETEPEFDEVVIEKQEAPKQKAVKETPEKAKSTEKKVPEKESEKEKTDIADTDEDSNNMVDILNFAEPLDEQLLFGPTEEKPEKEKFFKTKKGKIVKAVIIILVLLIVAAGAFAVYYVNNMLNQVTEDDNETPYVATEYYDGMDFLQEDFPMIEEQSAYDVYSYKEYLKYWYQNGDPVRSSHVLNVLLIGEDTREEKITDTSRADSAIIASINVDTGTIHLTSILRDLLVYYEVNGEGHYGKINESASVGGMNTYITTIERYYKISIDNYAVVNFASFPKIIDALGGVDINITSAEINEINNHPYTYGDVGEVYIEKNFEGNEGVMKLDGIQALAYCRIRHIDSDNARADRQKNVLNELFKKIKGSGTLDAVKVVNQLSQYTKTGYTKKELISIGNLALRDGWLNYEIQTRNVPSEENSQGGQNFPMYNAWIWIADIPKEAYELQMAIYGKSNIHLNENRPDYISMGKY